MHPSRPPFELAEEWIVGEQLNMFANQIRSGSDPLHKWRIKKERHDAQRGLPRKNRTVLLFSEMWENTLQEEVRTIESKKKKWIW